jgi:hypothetical protein
MRQLAFVLASSFYKSCLRHKEACYQQRLGSHRGPHFKNEGVSKSLRGGHSLMLRSLRAFAITETELKLIAAAAIIGLSNK